MKTAWFCCVLAGTLALGGITRAAENATVKKDKVNVRGQAALGGEVITQLNKGEVVTIVEEITVKNAKKGDPAKWARILLPANTPVWVFAPYIEPANKTVNVNRVNLRGGPGENFSVLGRLERGTTVKELRTVNNWMEIEAPPEAAAFVALEYLEKAATTAAAEPSPAPVTTTPPPTAPGTVQAVVTEPAVKPADDTPAQPAVSPQPAPVQPAHVQPAPAEPVTITPAPSTIPQVEPPPVTAPAPRRVVIREGRVIYARSIQAPTKFALESLENHRLINYLHTETAGLNLKTFAGRKVLVTGEELLDARWAYTPILDVDDIRLTP